MTRALLFLSDDSAADRWVALADGAVLASGAGVPVADEIVAVVPAAAVTLHWAALPVRSAAQATAAARIVVAEASAAPVADLHVAVGDDDGRGERPIAVVTTAAMTGWLARLARLGIDPVAVVPAPMLIPAPDEGFVRADLPGQAVVRGVGTGFADEAWLTPIVTGGVAPVALDPVATDAALVAAAAAPALDLRQGPYARRRRRGLDWGVIRRSATMALGVLALTLAIDVVRIMRYSFTADALEARADAVARTGLGPGATVVDADRQLAERLRLARGPGLGFAATVAAVFAAVRTVPGAEVTALDFQPTGTLRLSLATAREQEPTDVKRAIEAAGFAVGAGTFTAANGRVTGEMTVSVP